MNRSVVPLSRAAASFVTTGGWAVLGFARLEDYARERLGRSGRWLRDLAALGEILQKHRCLARAVTGEDGGRPIGRVAALLIGRAASPRSLDRWIALSRRISIRQLRGSLRAAGSDGGPAGSRPLNAAGSRDGSCSDSPGGEAVRPRDGGGSVAGGDPEDRSDRSLTRIQMPHAVRVAFDEVLDLFRCVEGTEASVTSFIEALVAECPDHDLPADAEVIPLTRTRGRALVEELLARSTNQWAQLPRQPIEQPAARTSAADLLAFEALHDCAGKGDAAALDRQLRRLILFEDRLSVRLGQLLTEMGDLGAWARLRFAGPGHYAEERLRIGRSRAEDRARVARPLRRYPALRDAYERGLIGLEATQRIARLLGESAACREIEQAWVRHAAATTIKRLRDETRALGRGFHLDERRQEASRWVHDGPRPGPALPGARPLRQPLSDAEWQRSLHRAIGTARDRTVRLGLIAAGLHQAEWMPQVATGPPFGSSEIRSSVGGETSIVVLPESTALIALPPNPDVFLRLRLPSELCSAFLATVEAVRLRLARQVDGDPWTGGVLETSSTPSAIAARTFSIRARRIPAWVGLLAMLEEFVAVWDRQHRPSRPARDAVFIREGWRCAAPGCTSRRNLENHHVVYRSRSRDDSLSNRICICRFHHQLGEHGDFASCHGRAPLGIIWRLGRAGIGGRFRNERRIEAAA